MKYKYDKLVVEITRECNLQCAHCLRGDAQNITMSKDVIDKIFEDAEDCKEVFFTGGEPLLALDEIEYFVDKLLASNWTTNDISMIINGTIRNRKLIDIANRFCRSKNGIFQIIISDDEFHNTNESIATLKFYQNCEHEKRVIVIPQKELIEIKQIVPKFNLSGRAVEYYKNHPQLDSRWVVGKEEQTNHRLCILKDRIPCEMYITVRGGFESYVAEEFSIIDRLSYGSILQSSMTELIKKHNDDCVTSCHDAYLINYFNNSADTNELLSKLVCQVNVCIIERFIDARKTARKLYPFVSAFDIIMNIPLPDFFVKNTIHQEILQESEHITESDVRQYVDAELINYVSEFDNLKKAHEELLQTLALLRKSNAIISPNRVYGSGNLEKTSEFQKLAALNQRYADGELIPNNSINIQCAEVYGKSFREYEVEKIQKSDLPDEIKMISLRKDEILEKVNQEITKKCEEFLTGLMNDFADGVKAIKTADGLRCGYCSKVIQYQGRNIHCVPTEDGLQCQYCKNVNVV